jgi:hypothetical protein
MVGLDARQAKAEIDNCVQAMAVWNVRRDVLLRRLMDFNWIVKDPRSTFQVLAGGIHGDPRLPVSLN